MGHSFVKCGSVPSRGTPLVPHDLHALHYIAIFGLIEQPLSNNALCAAIPTFLHTPLTSKYCKKLLFKRKADENTLQYKKRITPFKENAHQLFKTQ